MNKEIMKNGALLSVLAVLTICLVAETKVLLGYTLTGTSFAANQAAFYINPNFVDAAAGSQAQQIAAIQAAADEWTLEGGSNFAFQYQGTTSVETIAADGINSVYYSNTNSNGALAVCYWWSIGGNTSNFDIVYYDGDGSWDFVWATNPTFNQFDIESAGVHEFGHALGLDHSPVIGSSMYPSITAGSTAVRSLDNDDIAGVQAIYGVAPPTFELSGVSPDHAWIDGGDTITINGQGISPSITGVSFGGVPATDVTRVSATTITCRLPAGIVSDRVDVVVSTPGGSVTLEDGFRYDTCRVPAPITLTQWSDIELKVPNDAGFFYVAFVAGSQIPTPLSIFGDLTDSRTFPLDFDILFWWSVWTLEMNLPYFSQNIGVVAPDGSATFRLNLPNIPGAAGLSLQFCFMVAGDPNAPSGVRSVTNAASGLLQSPH